MQSPSRTAHQAQQARRVGATSAAGVREFYVSSSFVGWGVSFGIDIEMMNRVRGLFRVKDKDPITGSGFVAGLAHV